jgi:hypothetical protein
MPSTQRGGYTLTSKQQQTETRMTKAHFSEYIETRWNKGKRIPITIRQNEDLYKAFKPVAKRLYGSVCRAIETFEATVVLIAQENVHF